VPWWVNARHLAQKGHVPEWVALGGLAACMRCVKGGRRERIVLPIRRLTTVPTWS
jgi:hypothetical protein